MMDGLKKIFILLGSLDRRTIFFIVGFSVLIPLIKPSWVSLPIEIKSNSQRVFDEIESLEENSKVILSFDYGPSTMPEIHPMSIALLRHMFAKKIKVYGLALWPDGNFMSTDAFSIVKEDFNVSYDKDYVNLGYKPGGEAVIQGLTSDIRVKYKSDLLGNNIDDLTLMVGVNKLDDFDFAISLSAGDPGSKQWVQFGTDPAKLPFTTGCTSIQVTDIIPYVENNQIRGILEGMPGAAEYEKLVEMKLNKMNIMLNPGKASSMMSAQSIAHVMIVLFIVFGNIAYFLNRREKGI
ncbi:MAG: hypothetical protein VX820_04855 [Candidatus Neomarinimicrobiota bacterium]|nr:hypothetical protein [Candidatus Neomarinimicrobiota bacterium]|tara:strand:+ start:513 stop:1391 length:879 start_codon:yes stop_codon:yes gene_type:complete